MDLDASDSSDLDDAGDYTETGVLLGYAVDDPLDDTISHLGGWPVFPIFFCCEILFMRKANC
jgi:pre-rRNA-processing protein TSR4